MKNLLLLLVIACAFGACSPDQNIANQMQGDWTTTAQTRNGSNSLVVGDSWTFHQCSDISKGDCSGTYTYPSFFGNVTISFLYKIYNNGTQFSIDFPPNSASDVNDANIMESSATKIKINYTQSNGDYYEQTLTKK